MGFPRQEYCECEAKVKVTQSCLTLCDLMDCTVHGILQARKLEWIASPLLQGDLPNQLSHQGRPEYWVVISFSRGSSQPRDRTPHLLLGRQILYHGVTWETHAFIIML